MAKALTGAREEVSENAPRITTFAIPRDKIREVIGSGGKVIREIVETTGAKVDIDDDGTIKVSAVDAKAAQAAIDWIRGIVAEPEIGVIYPGKVVKVVDFGAFVNFLGSRDGLVHISESSPQRVGKVADVVKIGDRSRSRCSASTTAARSSSACARSISRPARISAPLGAKASRRREPATGIGRRPRARRSPLGSPLGLPAQGLRPFAGRRRGFRILSPQDPGSVTAVALIDTPAGHRASRGGGAGTGKHAGRAAPGEGAGRCLGRVRRAADRRRRAGFVPRRSARPHHRPHGPVAGQSLATIRQCDAGSWFGPAFAGELVPTLEEALALAAELDLGVNIEIKADSGREYATADAVADAVSRLWPAQRRLFVSSFLPAAIAVLRDLAPQTRRGVLFRAVPSGWAEIAKRLGVVVIGADHRRLRPRRVAEVRAAGYQVASLHRQRPGTGAPAVRMGRDFRFLGHARYDSAGRRGK